MLKFFHRSKPKHPPVLTNELLEQKALEKVMPQAREKARQELCEGCLSRHCFRKCHTFGIFSQVYAWDIIFKKAKLN